MPVSSISGSDFVEMFVGVVASRVRGLFERGKKHAPCILFIDEIDAVGRREILGKVRSLAEQTNILQRTANMALVPRKITDADVERVLTATLESTPRDATHWSTRSLAQHCDMSQTAVARIWKAFALQPQRVDTFKLSKDPLFIDKVRDIVGLYLDPPARAVPADLDVHLILDNYGTHKTAPVRRWFARHPRLHVHFTPASASWLNLVERWLARLTQKQIKRGAHRSTRALETAIREYLTISNEAPKPFVWHNTADEILASVARYCQRISNSGH